MASMLGIVALILIALPWATPASTHDGANDLWYDSLYRSDGMHCCGGTDCRETEAELRGGAWWARDPDGAWREIPREYIVDKANPTGAPVLCARRAAEGWVVLCFVPGALT